MPASSDKTTTKVTSLSDAAEQLAGLIKKQQAPNRRSLLAEIAFRLSDLPEYAAIDDPVQLKKALTADIAKPLRDALKAVPYERLMRGVSIYNGIIKVTIHVKTLE